MVKDIDRLAAFPFLFPPLSQQGPPRLPQQLMRPALPLPNGLELLISRKTVRGLETIKVCGNSLSRKEQVRKVKP